MSLLVELLSAPPASPSDVDGRVVLLNLLHELENEHYPDLPRLVRLLQRAEQQLQKSYAQGMHCTAQLALNILIEHAEADGGGVFWAADRPQPTTNVVRVVTLDDLLQHLLDHQRLSGAGFGAPSEMDDEALYGALNHLGAVGTSRPLRANAMLRGRRAFCWVTMAEIVRGEELWHSDEAPGDPEAVRNRLGLCHLGHDAVLILLRLPDEIMQQAEHRRPSSIEAGDHRRYRARHCTPSTDHWGRAVDLARFPHAPAASDGAPECVLATIPATQDICWSVIGRLSSRAELGDDHDFLSTLHDHPSNEVALAEARRRLDGFLARS